MCIRDSYYRVDVPGYVHPVQLPRNLGIVCCIDHASVHMSCFSTASAGLMRVNCLRRHGVNWDSQYARSDAECLILQHSNLCSWAFESSPNLRERDVTRCSPSAVSIDYGPTHAKLINWGNWQSEQFNITAVILVCRNCIILCLHNRVCCWIKPTTTCPAGIYLLFQTLHTVWPNNICLTSHIAQ